MILPDANLILYAYDLESPFHPVATTWWTKCLSEVEPVGLTHVILFGFLRLSTSPRVFAHPFPMKDAIRELKAWSERPNVRILPTGAVSTEVSKGVLAIGEGSTSGSRQARCCKERADPHGA
jgi:predicted nucleic acid-binding protein